MKRFVCSVYGNISRFDSYKQALYQKYCKPWKINLKQNFDICRFCVVICFFHPRHNGQWPPTLKDFYTRSYPLHYFIILIIEKEPVFSFSMLSAKQGNYWYHFYNVFGMTRSLTGYWTRDLPHSKPALFHKAIEEAVSLYYEHKHLFYPIIQSESVCGFVN